MIPSFRHRSILVLVALAAGSLSCGTDDTGAPSDPPCDPNPCLHGGTCTEVGEGHTCACPATWGGSDCGVDVDECGLGLDDCDPVNGVCANTDGGFSCSCTGPTTLDADGHTCVPTCSPACSEYAHCVADGAGAACVCDPGHADFSPDHDGTDCDGPPEAFDDGPVAGDEDLPLVITLRAQDGASAPLTFVVDALQNSANAALRGRLFQYNDALATDASAVEIVAFPATVEDAQGRLIYLPAADCNSDGLPMSLLVEPSVVFHAFETGTVDGDAGHTSAQVETAIRIAAINDAPSATPPGDDSVCWQGCTFQEDFGNGPEIVYPPAVVFAGGSDLEGAALSVVVTAVSCPFGTVVTFDGVEVVASTTVTIDSSVMQGAFYFRPLPDTSGSPYCTVTYRVNDGQLDSPDTHTVTIGVTPVDDLPRLVTRNQTTYEDVPLVFQLEAADIDSFDFTARFVSCTVGDVGTLWSGSDPIDCGDLSGAPVLASAFSTGSWELTYIPPPQRAGLQMMVVELELNDGRTTPIPDAEHGFIFFDVLAINDAPLVAEYVAGTDPVWTDLLPLDRTAAVDEDLAFDLLCDDVDAGSNLMSWDMTTDLGTITFSPDADLRDQLTDVLEEPQHLSFLAPLSVMKQLLHPASIHFSSSAVGTANVRAVLDDRGFVGSCPPDGGIPGAIYCPLTAEAQITVVVE